MISEIIDAEEYNTCYYNAGTKHETCTHQHYCIFNKNRLTLEKQLTSLNNKLNEQMKSYNSLRNGNQYTTAEVMETKEAIRLLNTDLNNLRKFERRIKNNKEVKNYGYMEK